MSTVAETIKEITRKHLLENNGLMYGQCVTAVGWIGGTVPELTEDQGIVELPTSDSSNPGVVCGAGLSGRRPIYAIRYQGFMTYNSCSILNYAAKSKEMWDVPCPVFVRSIGMEGSIGPVAGGMHHSMVVRHPGIPVFAPITPTEWEYTWNHFMSHDDPVYCSEHRLSFKNSKEIQDVIYSGDKTTTIIQVGPSRLKQDELVGLFDSQVNIINCFKLKPFTLESNQWDIIKNKTDKVIIVDSDYEYCSVSKDIAYEIMLKYKIPCHVIGLEDRTSGFGHECDNLTPTPQKIYKFAKEV